MKLRPRHKGVVLRLDERAVEEKTASGLVLPQNQWSMHPDVIEGTVETTGADCLELKEGMRIIIGRFAGVKIDERQILVDENDVIAEVIK